MEIEGKKRQLAAIMFTDIVGYTALMGKDSDKALELIRISKEIQKPLVEKHNGKWLKEMGDGAMAQFSTALDAVNCSIEIQENARAKLDAKLRIGIHLGDVTVEENDVHGDGVNVASRLESIADPGGIYVSDAIEKAIRGQSDVQAKLLGDVSLKNVDYGVKTYALQGVGLPVPEVKDEKELSGHFLAELQRRGVLRSGATYVVLSLLLILLVPYTGSLVDLPQWSKTALLTVLTVGLPIALYLAWNYERSPEGFVRTTSRESWQNTYSTSQRKPLTGNFIIVGLILVIIVMYAYPRYLSPSETKNETATGVNVDDKSIAVLPFVNMSNDPDQEYFSDGLSEELINLLTKIPELKVIARTSSFSFKGKNEDVRDIGQKLGVSFLLEGSVRKSGNDIRITAQLIKTDDGSHLWSETYDRQLIQIFAVQDEIAEKVVGQLKLKISGLTQQPLNQRQAEAHNLLLEANYIANHQQDAQEEVIELLEQAIGLDSTNARIWQRLSGAYLTWRGTRDSRMQTTTLAKKAARRAIELAPDYGHGYRALGQALFVHDWDFLEGEKMFRKAYQLDPEMFHALWVPNIVFGRYEEVILISKQGVLKDPLSSHDWWALGTAYLASGRPTEAVAPLQHALELNPQHVGAIYMLGFTFIILDQYDNALRTLDNIEDRESNNLATQMAILYYAMGKLSESDIWLEKAIMNNEKDDNSFLVAVAFAQRGEADKCFEWLERAYDRRNPMLTTIKNRSWYLSTLRNDPRYNALLDKMGIPID